MRNDQLKDAIMHYLFDELKPKPDAKSLCTHLYLNASMTYEVMGEAPAKPGCQERDTLFLVTSVTWGLEGGPGSSPSSLFLISTTPPDSERNEKRSDARPLYCDSRSAAVNSPLLFFPPTVSLFIRDLNLHPVFCKSASSSCLQLKYFGNKPDTFLDITITITLHSHYKASTWQEAFRFLNTMQISSDITKWQIRMNGSDDSPDQSCTACGRTFLQFLTPNDFRSYL